MRRAHKLMFVTAALSALLLPEFGVFAIPACADSEASSQSGTEAGTEANSGGRRRRGGRRAYWRKQQNQANKQQQQEWEQERQVHWTGDHR